MSAAQAELFGPALALPEGFVYLEHFVDEAEERALLESIAALPLVEARYKEYTARRRIALFEDGVPPFLDALRAKIAAWLGVPATALRHALVNEYRPGTPLGWHRDVPQFEVIVGVSLAAEARMRLRPWPPRASEAVFALSLPPRSAYVLRGEVRWRWQHSVEPTRALRYSITFRTRVKER